MRKETDVLQIKHYIEKYQLFWQIFAEIFGGVIFRNQLLQLVDKSFMAEMENFQRLGLIKSIKVGHNRVFLLTNSKFIRKSQHKLTSDILKRSILRQQFYLAQNCKTFEAILKRSNQGNDKVNRKDTLQNLLQNLDGELKIRGYHYDFINQHTISTFRSFAAKNIFFSHGAVKNGKFVPIFVIYELKTKIPRDTAKNIDQVRQFVSNTFSKDVLPKIYVVRFGESIDNADIKKELAKLSYFWQDETLQAFDIIPVNSSLGYVCFDKLV